MLKTDLYNYLEQLHPVPPDLKAALEQILVLEHYRKDEVIFSPASASRRIWYVHSGYLYRYQFKEAIRITDLYKNNSIILCCNAVQEPQYYVKVLADCTLSTISQRKFQKLMNEGLNAFIHERLLLLHEIARRDQAECAIRMPAKYRLRKLLAEYPEIFRIASLDVITSYLNISKETLNKLRKEE